jgi:hypothetical protein
MHTYASTRLSRLSALLISPTERGDKGREGKGREGKGRERNGKREGKETEGEREERGKGKCANIAHRGEGHSQPQGQTEVN